MIPPVILWSLLVVLGLICSFALGLFFFHAKKVKQRQSVLEEALWARRAAVPLLLETFAPDMHIDKESIIALRADCSSGAFTLEEVIYKERELTAKLHDAFLKNHAEEAKSPSFIALEHEFGRYLEAIRRCLNDYNYATARFNVFAFKKAKRPLLALL